METSKRILIKSSQSERSSTHPRFDCLYFVTMEEIVKQIKLKLPHYYTFEKDGDIIIHGVVHYKKIYAIVKRLGIILEYRLNPSNDLTTLTMISYE